MELRVMEWEGMVSKVVMVLQEFKIWLLLAKVSKGEQLRTSNSLFASVFLQSTTFVLMPIINLSAIHQIQILP